MGKSKRKILGFINSGFSDDFSRNMIEGIRQRAEEEDINFIVLPGKFIGRKLDEEIKYEYQYNYIFSLANKYNVDALIIASDCVGAFTGREMIDEFLKQYKDIPVVLMAGKHGDIPNISYENYRGIKNAVTYLVEEKGCRHFAVLSGPKENTDSFERKENYAAILKQYGIELGEDAIAVGDLSRNSHAAAAKLLDNNPDVEAIFCINDDMALSLYEEMKKRNLVPGKDIYVFGYDNTVESGQIRPSLSSIWADSVEMGRQAFDMVMDRVNGRFSPSRTLDTIFIRRDSFGSDEKYEAQKRSNADEIYNRIFYRIQGNRGKEYQIFNRIFSVLEELVGKTASDVQKAHKRLLTEFKYALDIGLLKSADIEMMLENIRFFFNKLIEGEDERNDKKEVRESLFSIYEYLVDTLVSISHDGRIQNSQVDFSLKLVAQDIMQFENGSDQNYAVPLRKLPLMEIGNAYLYVLSEPIMHLDGEPCILPDTLELKAVLRGKEAIPIPSHLQKLSINEVFSNQNITENRYTMIAFPLFSRELFYGFLLCDLSNPVYSSGDLLMYQLSTAVKMLKILKDSEKVKDQLEDSLVTLKENNIALDTLSKRDVMTGALNRRGFYEKANTFIQEHSGGDKNLFAMYVDMDNLKIVNDRYGHDEGDFSIKLIAEKLSEIVFEHGYVGRLGGDEFACVFESNKDAYDIRADIKEKFYSFNRESDKEYNVTASVGIYMLEKGDVMEITDALSLADEDLYLDKQKRSKAVSKQ